MISPHTLPLHYPVQNNHNCEHDDAALPNSSIANHATATDAAIACSRLPILEHCRKGATSFRLAIVVAIVNLLVLIVLVYYFTTSCTTQYGVLPNDFTAVDVPPSLAALEDQAGVTITRRTLVHYQANATFTQLGGAYWQPFEVTCGCEDTCTLLSCRATIPITVEYEQCHPWDEVSATCQELLSSKMYVRCNTRMMCSTSIFRTHTFLHEGFYF